jgi:hypothetical protein
MLTLTAACVLVVLVAVWARISAGWPERIGVRGSAALASIGAPVALLIWLPAGPLAPGWAKRAGTPTSLLPAASARAVSTSRTTAAGTSMSAGVGSVTARGFTAQLTGSVSQSQLSSGLVRVDLRLAVAGQPLSALEIRIDGQPAGGGVEMTSSAVSLGTQSDPALYTGVVTGLDGGNVTATVQGAHGAMTLLARLQISRTGANATGALTASPQPVSVTPHAWTGRDSDSDGGE